MINKKYLCLDVELGGLEKECSLLTAFFGVYSVNFKELDVLDLKIKNDLYIVTAQGMKINGINLINHDLESEYKTTAGNKLREFLIKNSNNGSEKLIPVGHGIVQDLEQIYSKLLNRLTFEQYVSYRRLDTSILTQFFQLRGDIPVKISGSLESLKEYFYIPDCGILHTASGDAKLTIQVLKKLLEL